MSVSLDVQIMNPLGLHARPAAQLVRMASQYASEVTIARDGVPVNAKSIMGVMMLAAGKGSRVLIEADGEDADAALSALLKLIGERFGEEE